MSEKHVIALGFFDGVHIGHSALMKKTVEVAHERNLTPSVITFDSHPLSVVTDEKIPLLSSPEERAELIRRLYGIDEVICLRFDSELAHMPWDEFAVKLVKNYDAAHLVCGYDYTFGNKGQGNAEKLREKCRELGITCDVIEPVRVNGERVSSTMIRKMIENGEMEKAAEYLGHFHTLTDTVRAGKRLGRTINAPTINMTFPLNVIIPRYGVYATIVTTPDGKTWHGVTNVGVRPTVDDSEFVTAETYIIGFSGNLYGCRIRLEFCAFLRDETKFESIDALKEQIAKDTKNVEDYFSARKF